MMEIKIGEVILLPHEIPTSGWLYQKMIPLLTDKGYRVIAPNMLGFGLSDSPKEYETYIEKKQAQRLLDLMHFLKIDAKNIHLLEVKHFIQEEKPKEISDFIHSFIQTNEIKQARYF